MSNYNTTLQSNNTDLQTVLQTLKTKAAGGTQATPIISVSSNGLITATAGTKSSTHQLAFQSAKTITPSTVNQIAVSSGYYTGGNITVAGDSNLVAGNIKSGVSIFGVSGTLNIDNTNNDETTKIINRTITEINNNTTYIGSYAFYNCSQLKSVNFPECTTIRTAAFGLCSSLITISFPKCTNIYSQAFQWCKKLTTINFPECKYIQSDAFYHCSNLTTAIFPKCSLISQNAFGYCYSLATISFPECTNIGTRAFINSNLVSVDFPKCKWIDSSAFLGCRLLTVASFGAGTKISTSAFYNCEKLYSLTMSGSSVCTLAASDAFNLTPYTGYSSSFLGTPRIYVPSSLITLYQSATNWTYFSSYFSAIENIDNNFITFAIEGRYGKIELYQATPGMTWEEWVESEYNFNNFIIQDGVLAITAVEFDDSSGTYLRKPNRSNELIEASEKIINNGLYLRSSVGWTDEEWE